MRSELDSNKYQCNDQCPEGNKSSSSRWIIWGTRLSLSITISWLIYAFTWHNKKRIYFRTLRILTNSNKVIIIRRKSRTSRSVKSINFKFLQKKNQFWKRTQVHTLQSMPRVVIATIVHWLVSRNHGQSQSHRKHLQSNIQNHVQHFEERSQHLWRTQAPIPNPANIVSIWCLMLNGIGEYSQSFLFRIQLCRQPGWTIHGCSLRSSWIRKCIQDEQHMRPMRRDRPNSWLLQCKLGNNWPLFAHKRILNQSWCT